MEKKGETLKETNNPSRASKNSTGVGDHNAKNAFLQIQGKPRATEKITTGKIRGNRGKAPPKKEGTETS